MVDKRAEGGAPRAGPQGRAVCIGAQPTGGRIGVNEMTYAKGSLSLPPMPEEVCFQQEAFREAGMFTQTHCVVTWIIADARGAPMFRDKRGAFICRSDGGELAICPVDYGLDA